MLLNSPRVQQRISVVLATELENKIGTRVRLGGVHWLFPNDIVIDSLTIDDQEGESLLAVKRVAAKIEWMPLIKNGQMAIRNIRLFEPSIVLYQDTKEAAMNYQFLIDAFAQKKEKKKDSKLDLCINSLIIRRAEVKYDMRSAIHTPQQFNPHHIAIKDLSTHLSLKVLTNDSISVIVRNLNFVEQSGLKLDDLYFRLVGNLYGATLANFRLNMPRSTLNLDTLWVNYSPEDFVNSLIVKGKVLPSSVSPSDLAGLAPSLKDLVQPINLYTDFIGGASRINIKELVVNTPKNEFVLRANGNAHIQGVSKDKAQLSLQEFTLTQDVWNILEQQVPNIYSLIPAEVVRLGTILLKGNVELNNSKSHLELFATTDAGDVETQVDVNGIGEYVATVKGDNINMARILPASPLTKTDVFLEAEGLYDSKVSGDTLPLRGILKGVVTNSEVLGYEYDDIRLLANYSPEGYKGTFVLNDPNGALSLEAGYTPSKRASHYTFDMKADSVNLHALNIIDVHEGKTFDWCLSGDITGNTLNHVVGQVSVDSFVMNGIGEEYVVKNISIYSTAHDQKMLSLRSDFMEGSIYGEFEYQTLVESLMGYLHNYLPSLCYERQHSHLRQDNLCALNFKIRDTQLLQNLLLIPLDIDKAISVEGYLYDSNDAFRLQVTAPHVNYDGTDFSNVNIICETAADGLNLNAGGTVHGDNDLLTTAHVLANATDDRLNLGILWNSSEEQTFEGALYSNVYFDYTSDNKMDIRVECDSSDFYVNKSAWKLYPFNMHVAPQYTQIEDFRLEHDENRYVCADGCISDMESDSLNVVLNNMDLNYLLTLVKLKGISFGGNVSGHINAADLYTDTPFLDAALSVDYFSFCDGILGDALARAHWNQQENRLEFKADVSESSTHTTKVDGFVDFLADELWIDLKADSTNLSLLNRLLGSFMSDVHGNGSGRLLIGGPLDAIDLQGALLADVNFMLTPTKTEYHLKDSIRLVPGKIRFDGVEAFDNRGQKAIVNGAVTHTALNNFVCDLYVDAQNILGIDLPDTGNDSFYTTIFGTGEVHVYGAPDVPLEVDVIAQAEAGSIFALNLASQDVSSSESFITFRDRATKRNTSSVDVVRGTGRRRQNPASASLDLDVTAHITPDVTLKLVMNQAVDDHISVSGSGDLQINALDDDINLFGTYTVNRGFYRLSLQELINKDFEVVQGSTVTFDGDPMTARLNITARHTVNYVPLKDLSPDITGNVHVNCLLNIGGTLNAPVISFELELPQGTEEEKSILRSYTSTEEQRNMQFVYLLGLGKFYTMDLAQSQNPEGTGNMESFLSTTISGQINNLLSNIISSENWNFASNIRTENFMGGVADNTFENMEIEGILEGRLLDNRLLVNGNFGYRENPMYASNFIGDFDVRYLLRNDISLKGYNKTNDRYFSKTSLTTQGIGLIFQRDFDHLFKRRGKTTQPSKTFTEVE